MGMIGMVALNLSISFRVAAVGTLPPKLPSDDLADAMAASRPGPTNADASRPTLSSASAETATNTLRLNFRNAPLDLVLEYLSTAAGFVIIKETTVRGEINAWSKEPVTKAEAVELLNRALSRNGYTLIQNGRLLTILSKEAAQTADLEVISGNDPNQVQPSAQTVTQLIPVRYAKVSELVNNLRPLLPTSASLSVNEAANSIVMVATRFDIRRALKIIQALDNSIATVSTIRVYPLRYADAQQVANAVQQLFASQTSNSSQAGNANMNSPGMPGGGPPEMGGGPPGSGNAASSDNSRNNSLAKVIATSDETSNSVLISAPPSLVSTLASLVKQLDHPVTGTSVVKLFRLVNADPSELVSQLAQLFPDDSQSSSGSNPVRFAGPPGSPEAEAAASDSSETSRKQNRVLAVADPRTSSILVTAGSTLMPQIANLIASLDADPGHKEGVHVWDLRNTDPQDINQVLLDLFSRNTASRSSGSQTSTLLGQNNPLTSRQTQSTSTTSSSSGFGSSSSGSSGSGGNSSGGGGF